MSRKAEATITCGSAALGEIAKRDRVAEVARKTRASESAIRFYVSGQRSPTRAMRERFRDAYGIKSSAWDAAEGTPSRALEPPTPPAPERFPSATELRGATAERLLAIVTGNLEVMRASSSAWAPRDRIALSASTTAAIRELAKARGERMSEAAIMRLPTFQRVVTHILEVLEAYPEALAAIIARLEEVEGEGP